jgi:hypothetical protein
MQTLTQSEKDILTELLGKALNEKLHELDTIRLLRSIGKKVGETPIYNGTGELQITDFTEDKTLMSLMHSDLSKSLKGVSDKYGVNLRYGTLRYTNKGFGMKLEGIIPTTSPEELVANLKSGDQFKRKGTIFIVVSIDREAKTVKAMTTRRKMYLVRFDQLMTMMKVTPYNMGKVAFDAMTAGTSSAPTESIDFANLPAGDYNTGRLIVDGPPRKFFIDGKGKKIFMDEIEQL